MNNLERIKKSWAMGWSAVIETNKGDIWHILGENKSPHREDIFFVKWAYGVQEVDGVILIHSKITGYLYAGELAGNEPIPEGQKFKMKKGTKAIYTFSHECRNGVVVNITSRVGNEIKSYPHLKSEIEPYFD